MRRKDCSHCSGDAMQTEVFHGILIPFRGTALGTACVLFMKNRLNPMFQRALTGFVVPLLLYLLKFFGRSHSHSGGTDPGDVGK